MVISLFDGVGAFGEVFAFFHGHSFLWSALYSSEVEPACLRVLHHRFPTVRHLGDVQLVTDDVVEQLFTKHLQDFDVLLLAGGSPLASNSARQEAPVKGGGRRFERRRPLRADSPCVQASVASPQFHVSF